MIEHALLKYLGIYPETIERADEIVERVCEEYDIDSDSEVWEYVKQTFDEEVFDGQLSDFVVDLMFRNLAAALMESGKVDGKRIDYYVDGICSDFTIDGIAV